MKRYGHEKQTSCERAETAGSAGSARLPVCSAWAASQGAARHGRPGRLPQGRSRACLGLGAVAVGSTRRLAAQAWRSWGCAMHKKQSRTRAWHVMKDTDFEKYLRISNTPQEAEQDTRLPPGRLR